MNHTIKKIIYTNLAIVPLILNSCCHEGKVCIDPKVTETIKIENDPSYAEVPPIYVHKKNKKITLDIMLCGIDTLSIKNKNTVYLFDFKKLRKEALNKYNIYYNKNFPTICNLPKNDPVIDNIIRNIHEKRSTNWIYCFYPCNTTTASIDVLYDKKGHVNLNINNNLVIKPNNIKPINK